MSALELMEIRLIEEYDYERPRRGQLLRGVILKIEDQGVVIDVGLKRDGFVPREDVEWLGEEGSSLLELGQEVEACVVRPRDRDDNLILSLYQARLEKDWREAQTQLDSGDVWHGEVTECNRGGLVVRFGHLRGFVPASHLVTLNARGLSPEQRKTELRAYVGQELPLKVIEVKRNRRRLILSERLASRQLREQKQERLLWELTEGQVCRGTVSDLCKFGAFVDLGGADGLIHISEMAWQRARRPDEVLQVGDEIDVYVLCLDHERKRIGLSLKRLQPDPWSLVYETYTVDQLIPGTVTNVVDFGAFIALDIGIEGLVHISELADPPPAHPREMVRRGDELVLRVLSIDASRHRIALSLRQVDPEERERWLADQAGPQAAKTEVDDVSSSDSANAPLPVDKELEEMTPATSEEGMEEEHPETSVSVSVQQPDDTGFWTGLLAHQEAETTDKG